MLKDLIPKGDLQESDIHLFVTVALHLHGVENRPKVVWKKRRCGVAKKQKNEMLLPFWPLKHSKEYMLAYALHEAAHFIDFARRGRSGHDETFRRLEKALLNSCGWEPVFLRPHKYYDLLIEIGTGRVLYHQKGGGV